MKRVLLGLISLILIALLFSNVTGLAYAGKNQESAKKSCRPLVSGTYLTQIRYSNGDFSSRSIATFHDDGTLTIVDSAEGQPPGFSALRGTYECISKTEIEALALNFGFPVEGYIARTEWSLSVDKDSGNISGEVTLTIFDGLEDVDPLISNGGTVIDTLTFEGIPVPASIP